MINTGAGPLAWRTSRRSQMDNACVEVACAGNLVLLRDSKNRTGPTITINRPHFTTFLTKPITKLPTGNLLAM